MGSTETEEGPQEKPERPSMREFLEQYPPGESVPVVDAVRIHHHVRGSDAKISTPELSLHCRVCEGDRFFECVSGGRPTRSFLVYRCKNCGKDERVYALELRQMPDDEPPGSIVRKYGQKPPFGPQIPSRVVSLVGPDRDLLLKGRRAESGGLGIAAFAYYRRVVENQKNRLLDEIIRVAQTVNAEESVVSKLEEAKEEHQFSKAVESVKPAVPEVLLIDGHHNPLTLLHSALSEGLHELSDSDCLELARSIRVVLSDLAERIAQATRDREELKLAVSKLQHRHREDS